MHAMHRATTIAAAEQTHPHKPQIPHKPQTSLKQQDEHQKSKPTNESRLTLNQKPLPQPGMTDSAECPTDASRSPTHSQPPTRPNPQPENNACLYTTEQPTLCCHQQPATSQGGSICLHRQHVEGKHGTLSVPVHQAGPAVAAWLAGSAAAA